MNASTWSVVNRFNDIKIATFDTWIEANEYAIERNASPFTIDNPWFVSNY